MWPYFYCTWQKARLKSPPARPPSRISGSRERLVGGIECPLQRGPESPCLEADQTECGDGEFGRSRRVKVLLAKQSQFYSLMAPELGKAAQANRSGSSYRQASELLPSTGHRRPLQLLQPATRHRRNHTATARACTNPARPARSQSPRTRCSCYGFVRYSHNQSH